MTWISSKSFLVLVAVLFIIPFATAPHQSPGFSSPDYSTGFELPQYDSHGEIATLFVAPFIFIAILFKVLFNLLLNDIVDPGSGRNYGRMTSLMAVAVTAVMIPSPAWDYVILMMNWIVGLAILTLLVMFLLIFLWTAQAGSDNPRP